MLVHLKDEDFNQIKKEGKILVDFYADWCGPCKSLSPILEKAKDTLDIDIVKINVDEREDLAKEYGVMSIPTLVVFDQGREVKRNIGFMNLDEIKDFVQK